MEATLREREHTLMSIVMNSPSALSLKDRNGVYVIANKNYDRILGLDSEQMVGKKDEEIFSAEVAKSLRINDQKVFSAARRISIEERLPRKDGSVRTFMAHKFPIFDANQNAKFVCSISLDITENKSAAQALIESEAQMKELISSIPQLVWTCLPDGKCNFLSPQWIAYTGIGEKKQLGLDWLNQVIHPGDQERTYQHWMGAVNGLHPYDIEYRIKRHDGTYEWFKTRGTPIRDASGEITYWFGTCTNINEDIQLRRTLELREREFRTIANSIPQLAWMANSQGSLFWYNQRWLDYTGATLEEMNGWGWEKVHDPSILPRVKERWRTSIETGEMWEDTFPLLGKNNEWRWFLSRARPVRDESNKVQFWFGTNTDITENLNAERELKESKEIAEKANMAKTQFLANMSHEIRTPIGAIMGFTSLLKDKNLSEKDRDTYMAVVERNSENLLRLIDDILDLSKVEAGKIALEKSELLLPDFLAEFGSVMSLKAQEKGIDFVLMINGLVPDQVVTDQLRLKQILSNIVGNAIKFTDRGAVKMTVSYNRPELKFMVVDTGPGIATEHIDQLFKPFGQADPSMSRKFGGSGLGLILSKRLCNALGGDLIILSSEVGIGSTFVATIAPPFGKTGILIEQPNSFMFAAVNKNLLINRGRLAGLKILVAEDSPDNQMLLQIYLGNSGAKVEFASDGSEAVERALASQPDVVVMDIQMPKLDGHQATKKLRSLGFSRPIIALTAHAMRDERDKCFESGCNDYLTKPLNKDELLETLERYKT